MNKENKIVPKLRFPEFVNEGEWLEKNLGELCDISNGKANVQDHIENGKYPLFDRSESVKASNEYIFDCEAVIIPGEGMRFIPKYFKGKFNLHQRAYALKDFTCDGQFVYFSMLHRSNILSQKAVQSTVLSLRLPILQNFQIQIPSKGAEQQKIATCLSSLDELIAAHTDKLEALKDHKKGLMQQLFPAEGKKTPKRRFNEFMNSGDWKEKLLGQICDIYMCKRIFSEETNANSGVPFYKIGTLGGKPDAFINRELFEEYKTKYNYPRKGEILITCSGTVGKSIVFDGQDAYFQDSNIVWLDNPTLEICNELLYYLVSNVDWSMLNSTTITRIYGSDLRNLKLTFPKDQSEQKKIASTLSTIEESINIQELKIDALNTHKKGLMQGLFPNL